MLDLFKKNQEDPINNSISINSLKKRIDLLVSDFIVNYNNIINLEKPEDVITEESEKRKFLMQTRQTSVSKIRERIMSLLGTN